MIGHKHAKMSKNSVIILLKAWLMSWTHNSLSRSDECDKNHLPSILVTTLKEELSFTTNFYT
jgi:hypothetical protein